MSRKLWWSRIKYQHISKGVYWIKIVANHPDAYPQVKGRLAKRSDGMWTKAVTKWWPKQGIRSFGHPHARRVDDTVKGFRQIWIRLAHDTKKWQNKWEVHAQRW